MDFYGFLPFDLSISLILCEELLILFTFIIFKFDSKF